MSATATMVGVVLRLLPAPRVTLCGYLGCGELATRAAYDRHCNRVRVCPDPAHGKGVLGC